MAEKVFVAKWYHMIFYPDWLRRLIEKPHRYLSELVTAGMRVADVGCGTYTLEPLLVLGSVVW